MDGYETLRVLLLNSIVDLLNLISGQGGIVGAQLILLSRDIVMRSLPLPAQELMQGGEIEALLA